MSETRDVETIREELEEWNIHAVEWLSECDPYMKGNGRNAHGLITRARELFAVLAPVEPKD